MKNYLNLDGLNYFLNKLFEQFATKESLSSIQEDAITDEEIDAICGQTLNLEDVLVDQTTGDIYKLYVNDGKFSMEEIDNIDMEQLKDYKIFIDETTDTVYKLYVSNGELNMMEVE